MADPTATMGRADRTRCDLPTITRVRLTPKDHGREIDPDVFEHATGEEGYHYEIINGRVYVAPVADVSHDLVEDWLYMKLKQYSREHPEVINHVTTAPRIFIPTRAK